MNHNELVVAVSEFFAGSGFEFANEVPLPDGRGAVDVCVYHDGRLIVCGEVKSSPASINQKKVMRQLHKYQDYFGCGANYALFSPGAKGIIVSDTNGFKGGLQTYLGVLKNGKGNSPYL